MEKKEKITEQDFEKLLNLLLRLQELSSSNDIKRVAKSLFNLLSRYRFSPDETKDITF